MPEEDIVRIFGWLPQIEGMLAKQPTRIAIKARGRIVFIDPRDVQTVEAQGNYVLLRRASGEELLREPISAVEEKLGPYGFIRIHRSVLINSTFVEEIQPCSTGEYVLRLKGGKEYTVSRTYKKNLSAITPLWFGTDAFSDG
jgi:two-component system, LytTR family, response regulator